MKTGVGTCAVAPTILGNVAACETISLLVLCIDLLLLLPVNGKHWTWLISNHCRARSLWILLWISVVITTAALISATAPPDRLDRVGSVLGCHDHVAHNC